MAELKDIAFEVIQKCPNNCLHCSSTATMKSKYMITQEVFAQVINEATGLGLRHVSFSGGEPFEHNNINEMVELCCSNGVDTSVYSSGVWSKYGIVEPLRREAFIAIKQAGLKSIMFNVPSVKQSEYDFIMGTTGMLPGVLENIKFAKTLGLEVEIHYVPMSMNLASLQELLKFASRYDIKVSFLRLVMQGRAVVNENSIAIDDIFVKNYIKQVLDEFKSAGIELRTRIGTPLSHTKDESCCSAAKSKVIIRYDGMVFPCEAYKSFHCINLKNKEIYPDNIHDKSIAWIWNHSPFLLYLRTEMQSFFCNDCENEICPAQYRLQSNI